MKEKVIGVLLWIGMYVSSLLLVGFFEYSVILKINELLITVPQIVYVIVFSITAFLLILVICFLTHSFEKEHLVLCFLKDHWVILSTISILVLLFVNSLHKEVLLKHEIASDLIAVEWTIFGISFCVFSVWRGLIFDKIYLGKEVDDLEEKEQNVQDDEAKLSLLREKQSLHRKYINSFYPVVIIIINAIALCAATGEVYLKDYDIYSETFAFFAAFCCTNTLIAVLQVVASALRAKKNELLGRTQVNPAEVNACITSNKLASVVKMFDEIDKETPLKNYKNSNSKMEEYLHRCSALLDDYRKNSASALENQEEWLSLYEAIGDELKKYRKKRAKMEKRIAKMQKELDDFYKDYPSYEKPSDN